ncbi:beta-ketoacyl synthase N-terminal-like domain-containing protein [Micromonospora inyonensis]|uniref:Nodulation protein E n=1 Tax=Micromonospora inyonensis TaxID=47866 RepID=A0A1C6RLG1_9ACTN|nr:beta-ketoacyl synthase N-terminal-like domain-containing protein [Micromonospora inyonensis]SCL17999.1 nodulation protein E [Micromonospora inyonensis]
MTERADAAALVREVLMGRVSGIDDPRLIAEDEPLALLGVDSVTLISLAADLQHRYGVTIEDEVVLAPNVSIASLAAALTGRPIEVPATDEIMVVGTGVVAPTGRSVEELWDALLTERAHRVDAPYPTSRRYRVGAVPGAPSDRLTAPDRLMELLVAVAEQALVGLDDTDRRTVHLVVGTTDTGGNALGDALDRKRPCGDALVATVADRAAQSLRVGGGATTVGSASASGAVALGHAQELLRAGEAEQVLVVGVDSVSASAFHGLAALRTLATDGCRPFSRDRKGIGVSEAAAAILLRGGVSQAGPAGAPSGRLAGYGASSWTTNLVAPESAGIELAVRRALAEAAIDVTDVAFVNTHGPGTRLGDTAEIQALRSVFGDRLPHTPLNSSKGLLWHCQGAAGVIESLVCLLCLEHGTVTPTTAGTPLDPAWSELDIVTSPRAVTGRYALSISCGLGGVNTALIWEAA